MLAMVILLDQFSRVLYEHSPRCYASDPMALSLAVEAIQKDFHNTFSRKKTLYLLMPLMHSEDILVQQHLQKLMKAKGVFDEKVLRQVDTYYQ